MSMWNIAVILSSSRLIHLFCFDNEIRHVVFGFYVLGFVAFVTKEKGRENEKKKTKEKRKERKGNVTYTLIMRESPQSDKSVRRSNT